MTTKQKKAVDHLDWHEFVEKADATPDHIQDALTKYFAPFARPLDWERDDKGHLRNTAGSPCINCEAPLEGGLAQQMLGTGGFRWGLVHGEGHCSACGWPARLYHFIKDADGSDMMTLRGLLLQYHPDFVEVKPQHRERAARARGE